MQTHVNRRWMLALMNEKRGYRQLYFYTIFPLDFFQMST